MDTYDKDHIWCTIWSWGRCSPWYALLLALYKRDTRTSKISVVSLHAHAWQGIPAVKKDYIRIQTWTKRKTKWTWTVVTKQSIMDLDDYDLNNSWWSFVVCENVCFQPRLSVPLLLARRRVSWQAMVVCGTRERLLSVSFIDTTLACTAARLPESRIKKKDQLKVNSYRERKYHGFWW